MGEGQCFTERVMVKQAVNVAVCCAAKKSGDPSNKRRCDSGARERRSAGDIIGRATCDD